MALELKKAQRSKAYLKLGLAAPSGGGKTAGALLIAYGMLKEKYPKLSEDEIWGKIAIVDTENGSGQLYVGSEIADTKIGAYNVVTLEAPFEVDKYTKALTLCHEAGMEVCILDSITHAWSGEGGLLEQQGAIAKRTGNSYTAWRDITPQHNTFVEKLLGIPMHVIATMRSKQEYAQEKTDQGKNVVRKLGMEPEQRKGMEYEFTIMFDIDAEHNAFGSKDRTSIFDQRTFTITPEIGKKVMRWLEIGEDNPPAKVIATTQDEDSVADMKARVIAKLKALGGKDVPAIVEMIKRYAPSGNPNAIGSKVELEKLYAELAAYEQSVQVES